MQFNPSIGWKYEEHPLNHTVKEKCDELLQELSNDISKGESILDDTRASHLHVYRDVVPDNCECFAGHYRGYSVSYLENYNVEIAGYLGAPAPQVEGLMQDFSKQLRELLADFSQVIKNTHEVSKRILHYCHLLSFIFTKFLVIHPYANGNGHMARLLAWVMLSKEGLNSNFWSVADRPDEPLDQCIGLFRNNNREPLIKYFMMGVMHGRPVIASDLAGVLPTP